jgi:hypothetical protein
VIVFGSCSGKDFMLEAVDMLKGVSPTITHFDRASSDFPFAN